jgi:ABC-type lipoprotein export system ATPase subunit/ABC-type antimicrobial peptide transport system permease subunit
MENEQSVTSGAPLLELRDIHKSYYLGKEEFPVLKGISLKVDRGDFVSLLGESGGGKSTLMNIIGGLDREYEGQVLVEGKQQKLKKEKDMDAYRRDTVGFIFQSFNLVSYLSVLDNVLVSLKMTNLPDKAQKQRALELIKQVGLYEHRKKKPSQLSGGQKQRVAIARALASDPEIILADEPTGALDSANTAEVLSLLEKIAKSGKTVIVVTHSQDVANHGTRIVHLEDGKVLDDTRIKEAYPVVAENKQFKPKALSYGDTFRTAFKHFLNAWKINLLIAIGSAIGLASVMFFLGLGNGATKYMNDQITSIANPDVFIVARRGAENQSKNNMAAWGQANEEIGAAPAEYYLNDDYKAKIKKVDNVKSVSSIFVVMTPSTLSYEGNTRRIDSMMSWSSLINESSLDAGKAPGKNELAIMETDVQALDPKAYADKNWKTMVGKTVDVTFTLQTANGPKQVSQKMTISGIMSQSPTNGAMTSSDTLKELYESNGISTETNFALVTINQTKNVKQATTDVNTMKVDGKYIFATQGVGSILDTISSITQIVSIVLAAIAGISLLVSIFMIIVTTYMSVAARTKEIGVIRAMGGRRKDISRLFTAESLILGVFSSIIAVVIAYIGQILINNGMHSLVGGDIVQVQPMMIVLAVMIALIIAFFASLAPSAKGARLNSIEALAAE